MATTTCLDVKELTVEFATLRGSVRALEAMTLSVSFGEVVGMLGESGCGKSVLAEAILGLTRPPGRVVSGEVRLEGRDVTRLDAKQWQRVRGKQTGLVVPNARSCLNPLISIGRQIGNVVRQADGSAGAADVNTRVVELLRMVGIPDAERRFAALPHEFSGGMCQRVIIAMAIANSPRLLIADEPTSGLDVTVQRQVLDLMRSLVQGLEGGVIIMSRDPGVLAHYCDTIVVMRRGRTVESGRVKEFFAQPSEPYSRELLLKATAAHVGTGRLAQAGGRTTP